MASIEGIDDFAEKNVDIAGFITNLGRPELKICALKRSLTAFKDSF